MSRALSRRWNLLPLPNALSVTVGVEMQPITVDSEGVSRSLIRGCLWLTHRVLRASSAASMRVMPLLNETGIARKVYGDFKRCGAGTTTVGRARGSEIVAVARAQFQRVYWAKDSGRPRNGMFFVESGRLGIEIERESRGARWRTRARRKWGRTNPRGGKPVALNYAARRSETMGKWRRPPTNVTTSSGGPALVAAASTGA